MDTKERINSFVHFVPLASSKSLNAVSGIVSFVLNSPTIHSPFIGKISV